MDRQCGSLRQEPGWRFWVATHSCPGGQVLVEAGLGVFPAGRLVRMQVGPRMPPLRHLALAGLGGQSSSVTNLNVEASIYPEAAAKSLILLSEAKESADTFPVLGELPALLTGSSKPGTAQPRRDSITPIGSQDVQVGGGVAGASGGCGQRGVKVHPRATSAQQGSMHPGSPPTQQPSGHVQQTWQGPGEVRQVRHEPVQMPTPQPRQLPQWATIQIGPPGPSRGHGWAPHQEALLGGGAAAADQQHQSWGQLVQNGAGRRHQQRSHALQRQAPRYWPQAQLAAQRRQSVAGGERAPTAHWPQSRPRNNDCSGNYSRERGSWAQRSLAHDRKDWLLFGCTSQAVPDPVLSRLF